MKIFITCVFFILINLSMFSQERNPYLQQHPKERKTDTLVATPFPFRSFERWIEESERFIFLPQDQDKQKYGYQSFQGDKGEYSTLPYEGYVGRIFHIIYMEKSRFFPDIFKVVVQMEDNGDTLIAKAVGKTIDDIGPVRDIDSARTRWLGKTFWYRPWAYKFYSETNPELKNCTPVTVVEVVAGQAKHTPVRLVLKGPKGETGHVDINVSGTNTGDILRSSYTYDEHFYTIDPRNIFKFSNKVWSAIEDGKVFVGMTAEQALLSWGEPKSINRTTTGRTIQEQWEYGSHTYLYLQLRQLSPGLFGYFKFFSRI
ncbi:MAG: hypothetical protein QME52_04605 [Bacteroidota bacterium]|nr:hypothetical protein [Bacteroidota bacterium]